MPLKTLKLANFRSYDAANFSFGPAINLVLGPNGAGKTNLLEAAYLLSSARSFRARDREMISKGQNWFSVTGVADKTKLRVVYKNGQKSLQLNNRKAAPEKFVGRLPAVLFEPTSVQIIAGGPEDRRRFLNRLLSAISPAYLRNLIDYRRTLKQRNALLRQKHGIKEQVFAWDIKLVELAAPLFEARQGLCNDINQRISAVYHQLAQDKAKVEFVYSTTSITGTYAESLLKQLTERLDQDIAIGHTSAGPHRDEVIIGFKNNPAERIASRGEQRTLTLALKILELQLMENQTGSQPLILLDDVFSELDNRRRRYLVEHLKGYQVVITATDAKGLTRFLPSSHVKIELGQANARRRPNPSAKTRPATRSQKRRSLSAGSKTTRTPLSGKNPRRQPQRWRAEANHPQCCRGQ